MPLASGTKLGPYEILGPLGAGGMGEVYRARDSKLERDVAIKVLPGHLTSDAEALIAVAVVAVFAAAGILLLRRSPRGAGRTACLKRVAVLPFENLGSPEDDYFADGIADQIRGKLTTPLPPVPRVAQDRPQLRSAPQEPALPEARRGSEVSL